MPAKSKEQFRLMQAVAHNPKFAKKIGIKPSVGAEYTQSNVGNKAYSKLPEKMAKGGDPRLSVSRGEKLPTSQGAGLTEKGRQKFNRATGANLKAPAPHPKTKADEGRKKSFCARMSGMPGPKYDDKGNLTRKAASLKRWNCPGW
jgi:hypothetical protein